MVGLQLHGTRPEILRPAEHIPAPLKLEYASKARDIPAPQPYAGSQVPSVRPPTSGTASSDVQDARAKRRFPKVRSRSCTRILTARRYSGSKAPVAPCTRTRLGKPSASSTSHVICFPGGSGESRGEWWSPSILNYL